MMKSMYSAVSGLKSHQVKMDVIANNIANVNTVGYKSSSVSFQDIYSQTISGATGGTFENGGTNPLQIGLGVSVGSTNCVFTEAAAQTTGGSLDLSIVGDGFFVVNDGATDYYTRAGNLKIDQAGNLVNSNGLFVQDYQGNNINLGTTAYHDISIDNYGQITGISNDDSRTRTIAQVAIAVFTNQEGLSKVGGNLYATTNNSGDPLRGSETITDLDGNTYTTITKYKTAGQNGAGTLKPGTLEMSNVDLSNEFTDMIVTQRGFQANSRVITTSDEMLEELVNLKR